MCARSLRLDIDRWGISFARGGASMSHPGSPLSRRAQILNWSVFDCSLFYETRHTSCVSVARERGCLVTLEYTNRVSKIKSNGKCTYRGVLASEGAVSHKMLYYQQLTIAGYQVSFYVNILSN